MSPTMAFTLTVAHEEGLNDNEVVYVATPTKGGVGNGDYLLVHRGYDDSGALVYENTKRLWWSGRGAKAYGNAYFYALQPRCTGVVIDGLGGPEVSNTTEWKVIP